MKHFWKNWPSVQTLLSSLSEGYFMEFGVEVFACAPVVAHKDTFSSLDKYLYRRYLHLILLVFILL